MSEGYYNYGSGGEKEPDRQGSYGTQGGSGGPDDQNGFDRGNGSDPQNGNDWQGGYAFAKAPDPHVQLATAALVCGIIGAVLGLYLYGVIFSGIGIVLAVLSRGSLPAMDVRGRFAILFGAIGIALAAFSLYTTLRMLPQILQTEQFQNAMEMLYGEDADQMMEEIESFYTGEEMP